MHTYRHSSPRIIHTSIRIHVLMSLYEYIIVKCGLSFSQFQYRQSHYYFVTIVITVSFCQQQHYLFFYRIMVMIFIFLLWSLSLSLSRALTLITHLHNYGLLFQHFTAIVTIIITAIAIICILSA